MRQFFLASTGLFAFLMAGAAGAQTPPPVVVPTPNPFTLAPGQTPGPGTITVRLNARINFFAQFGSDSGRNPGLVTASAAAGPTAANTKLSNYGFGESARLYPGFDGIAANGLKYGAAIEVRQDNAAPPGGGVNGGVSAASRARGNLYFRREYGYLGADQLGIVRFGSTDGAASLFTTGTFENFDPSGWNDLLPLFFTTNTQPTWPFADVGALYTTSKAVYLSPQFYGFDFGVSFEPNTGNVNEGNGNCPYANTAAGIVTGPIGIGNGAGCDAASSTSTGDYARRRSTVEAELRYRNTIGPIGVSIVGGYIGSGKVNDSLFVPAGTVQRQQFDGLSLADGGLQLVYGGLAFGGHITAGRSNGQFNLAPQGQRDSFGWIAGASYAIGPVIVGASFFDYQSAGSRTSTAPAVAKTRNEYGLDVGGTYTFAPGMNLTLSYLYGHRRQGGVDLLTGATSTTTAAVTTHNNVAAQSLTLGTQFRW